MSVGGVTMTARDKIIQSAHDLFAKSGYENITIADIIKGASVSRGGFYHHFSSKEDILEAIIDDYLQELANAYKAILNREDINPKEALLEIFRAHHSYKIKQVDDWPQLKNLFNFKNNRMILLKMSDNFQALTCKCFEDIMVRGLTTGSFHCKYPRSLASLWTKQFMHLHRMVQKYVHEPKHYEEALREDIAFSQNLINGELQCVDQIDLEKVMNDYIYALKDKNAHY